MKDKVLFFVLGAVLSTTAYFVGDMDKAGAQDDGLIQGDVIINGTLTVLGGSIVLYDNLDTEKKAEEIVSTVVLEAADDETSISVYNGPIDMNKKSFGSSATLYAKKMPNGQHVSAVSLLGEYSSDQWQLWSTPVLTKLFLKEQLDLD